jgi:hypothetical protein
MTKIEEEFTRQADEFLELARRELGVRLGEDITPLTRSLPRPLPAVMVRDFRQLSREERDAIRDAYFSKDGVAYFIVLNPNEKGSLPHHLFHLAEQMAADLHLEHPLTHPLENHPDIVAMFGGDSTVKVFDFAERTGRAGYREQGETSEMFAMHHDGLGSGGTVETAVLYADAGPLYGGYTYFQNMLGIAVDLAADDTDAYRALFLPDATEMIRPRGKGALKVVGPVLFLNEVRQPQSVFRSPSGEYIIKWREDVPALQRAKAILEASARPFALGSTFIHMSTRGHGCFIRNRTIAHGRTAFVNGPKVEQTRVLSRKWYMRSKRDAIYKHVPGLFVASEFASLVPHLFGPEMLVGEWQYDRDRERNVRKV